MRFKINKPVYEKDYGRTRFISKFLWLPREVDYEIRWLEHATIEQVVERDLKYYDNEYVYKYFWRDRKWIDPPINLK